jgi:hypothetical protein
MDWTALTDQGPLVAFALLVLRMLIKGVLHTDSEFRGMKADRDLYRDLALRGTHVAEHGADVADQLIDVARRLKEEPR